MYNLPSWVIPVLIVVAVLIVIAIIVGIALAARASKKKKERQQEADRARAAELRQQAERDRLQVEEQELSAREAQLQADRTRHQARQEEQAAAQRTEEARASRSQVDERLAEADRLDPAGARDRRESATTRPVGQPHDGQLAEAHHDQHDRRDAQFADDQHRREQVHADQTRATERPENQAPVDQYGDHHIDRQVRTETAPAAGAGGTDAGIADTAAAEGHGRRAARDHEHVDNQQVDEFGQPYQPGLNEQQSQGQWRPQDGDAPRH